MHILSFGKREDGSPFGVGLHQSVSLARPPRRRRIARADLGRAQRHEMACREERELIPQEEAFGQMEDLVGLFLTGLSGLSARCGGRDLAARRAIDKAVYDLRVEIAEACTKLADQRGEPPLDDKP